MGASPQCAAQCGGVAAPQTGRTSAGVCAERAGINLKYTHTQTHTQRHKNKIKAHCARLLSDPVVVTKTLETISSSTLRLMWRYPEYQPHGRPPAILALNFPCHTRRRIYSDLYQLSDKLSSSRWFGWLAARLRIGSVCHSSQ